MSEHLSRAEDRRPRDFSVSGVELLGVVALLLAYFGLRLHNVLALPLFMDEGYHIAAAERALEGDLIGPGQGYLLHAWLNAFLGPLPPAAPWISRVGTILLGMAGASALYALGRSFVSARAGALAVALWITTPLLLFFERMALSDPRLASLGVVTVWIAWRMMRSGRARWALALSGAIFATILMKASGIGWLPLPLVAVVLAPGWTLRRRLTLAAVSYGAFGAVFGAFLALLKARGFDYRLYLGQSSHLLGKLDASLASRFSQNVGDAWRIVLTYIGWPVLLLAALGALVWLSRRPRPALLTLLALGMALGGPLVFGLNLSSRYLLGHVPWVLLALACGVGLLIERHRRLGVAALTTLAVWIALFAIPFQRDAWTAPAELPLTDADREIYVAYDPSGYATREIGEALRDAEPLPALGLAANCQSARLAAYPLVVECPTIRWDSARSQDEIVAQIEARAAHGPLYVIGEALSYIDLSALPQPHTVLMTVYRPGRQTSVSLYRIEQGATRPAAP